MNQINELERQRDILIDYLRSKTETQDWHACRDACVDLEVIEAKLQVLKKDK